jgi:hypothetical protein
MGQSNSSHPNSATAAANHHHHHPHHHPQPPSQPPQAQPSPQTHPPSTHTPATTGTTATTATTATLDPPQPRPHGRSGSISNAAPTSPGASGTSSRQLKQKKASLDFPGLNSPGQFQRVPSALPSAPIPIPNASGRPREPPPRIVSDSDADLAAPAVAPSAHQQQTQQTQQKQQKQQKQQQSPILPTTQGPVPASTSQAPPVPTRDAPASASRTPSNASFTRRSRGEREQQHRRKKPYRHHTVRSNLPSGVPTVYDGIVNVVVGPEEDKAEHVPVLVTWRAPGKRVLVTGTYEPTPWENKTELEYE